jgi:hypothetical protein
MILQSFRLLNLGFLGLVVSSATTIFLLAKVTGDVRLIPDARLRAPELALSVAALRLLSGSPISETLRTK